MSVRSLMYALYQCCECRSVWENHTDKCKEQTYVTCTWKGKTERKKERKKERERERKRERKKERKKERRNLCEESR